jgi:hypothetical protein
MLGKLFPQELGFFDLFKESGDAMVQAIQEYRRMLDYPNIERTMSPIARCCSSIGRLSPPSIAKTSTR